MHYATAQRIATALPQTNLILLDVLLTLCWTRGLSEQKSASLGRIRSNVLGLVKQTRSTLELVNALKEMGETL